MSERTNHVWLQDIADAIRNIQNFTTDLSYETFSDNLQTKHAVRHNFTVIGEAVSKIPLEFKNMHTEVPWREMKGFRNYVVHEYFSLDDSIVWDIIQSDLPQILEIVVKLAGEERKRY